MIRGFARSVRGFVAQLSIVCIFLTGIPVSASAQQQSGPVAPIAPLTLAQMKRVIEDIEKAGVLDEYRLHVARSIFAIASATNAHQRSALIRALPVSILVTLKTDGRVVKEFSYRGTVRVTVQQPARDREEDDEIASGPHASASLPTEASELCFEDEEPPCATDAEMDEAAALAVYIEGESLYTHDQVEQELVLIEQGLPMMMCCDAAEETGSGPNASYNCVTQGVIATGSLVISAAEAVNLGKKVSGARLAGRTVASALLSTTGALALGTFLLAVAATNIFIECRRSPAPWHLQNWFEPVW